MGCEWAQHVHKTMRPVGGGISRDMIIPQGDRHGLVTQKQLSGEEGWKKRNRL